MSFEMIFVTHSLDYVIGILSTGDIPQYRSGSSTQIMYRQNQQFRNLRWVTCHFEQ